MSKKIPLRMCVGCREMREKRDLIRIVKNSEGKIDIDFSQKANGRGAYLCKNEDCLKKCLKTNALNRALKCNIDADIIQKIQQNIGV